MPFDRGMLSQVLVEWGYGMLCSIAFEVDPAKLPAASGTTSCEFTDRS